MKNIVPGEKHFTVGVWIITKKLPKKVLLIHHKKFNKWLQPGGHIEQFENPIESVIREVKEETGIDISFISKEIKKVDDVSSFLPVPKYFLEQYIPAYKNEPEHTHLDLMYVVSVDEQFAIHNEKESFNIGWFTLEQALALDIHNDTKLILQEILSI